MFDPDKLRWVNAHCCTTPSGAALRGWIDAMGPATVPTAPGLRAAAAGRRPGVERAARVRARQPRHARRAARTRSAPVPAAAMPARSTRTRGQALAAPGAARVCRALGRGARGACGMARRQR